MPLMKNIPYRLVSEATLKQCVFWIAYNQTPLFGNHENIREDEVRMTHRSLLFSVSDEPQIISRAKEQLLHCLLECKLVATGCAGLVQLDKNGMVVSEIEKINHIQWHANLSMRNWDDSTIGHPVPEGSTFFSYIHIPTIDLFKVFPHESMGKILATHENGDFFLDQRAKSADGNAINFDGSEINSMEDAPKHPDRKKGEPKQSTIEGRKADYDEVQRFFNLYKGKGGIERAAKEAARNTNRSWQALKDGHRHHRNYLRGQKSKK